MKKRCDKGDDAAFIMSEDEELMWQRSQCHIHNEWKCRGDVTEGINCIFNEWRYRDVTNYETTFLMSDKVEEV